MVHHELDGICTGIPLATADFPHAISTHRAPREDLVGGGQIATRRQQQIQLHGHHRCGVSDLTLMRRLARSPPPFGVAVLRIYLVVYEQETCPAAGQDCGIARS
eukprot:scaffold83273_cov30-Tisochrysis_lutea.AAC.5